MKLGCAPLLFVVAGMSGAWAGEQSAPVPQPAPRLAALTQPYDSAIYQLRITLPGGVPLCGMVDGFSSLEAFYIPVDPTTRCEQFGLPMNWDRWPDIVVVAPYIDTPLKIDTLADYVREEVFFCAGEGPPPPSGNPGASRAPASIMQAGRVLLGLETVTCERHDEANRRYSKALLAYRADAGATGRGYLVGAYARLENKASASRLLEQVVAGLTSLK